MTTSTPVQCSCAGNNPRCYKCGGWGYIDSIGKNRVISAPSGPVNSVIYKKRQKTQKNKVAAKPKNSAKIIIKQATRPQALQKTKMEELPPLNPAPVKYLPFKEKPKPIPGTRVVCRRKKVTTNAEPEKLSELRRRTIRKVFVRSTPKSKKVKILCKCGKMFSDGKYDDHLRDSCSIINRNAKITSKIKKGPKRIKMKEKTPDNQTSDNLRNTRKHEDLKLSRELDATRGYSGTARDHGSFGSHPSHDNYDEESSA